MSEVISEILKLSKHPDEADFFSNVLGWHYQEVLEGDIPIVLFGAGSAGVHLLKAMQVHGKHVNCFCDNNTEMIDGSCAGVPVISTDELRKDHLESLIVISTSRQYEAQIRDQLLSAGFSSGNIHTPLLESLLYYTNAIDIYWPPADLGTHARQLQETYDLLSDVKSRELFIHRMSLLTGGLDFISYQRFIHAFADLKSDDLPDFFSRPRYDENYFYFNHDFFPLKDDEVFANVGALVGDCVVEFVSSCRTKGIRYKEIINFEPDPVNFRYLSERMGKLPNVKCLPYGLWSHRSILRFSNPDQTRAGTPGWLDADGNVEVEVVSMDELLPDVDVSLIKMDVEGAEMEALRGASKTIRRNTPKLAISLYHKRNDIFDIPLYIHQLHPGYKFYLRHHSTTFGETVLFATP